jgi:2-oxoglutarate ferredoxin oxidoreductase subunit gamma
MTEKMIIAGFGGQGIILAGKLIAYAGMMEGLSVSHIPSYGAEMRGGTANCSVIVPRWPNSGAGSSPEASSSSTSP